MTELELKKYLKLACENFVSSKLATIQNTINSNKDSLDSESKSSAGDKHETGRAMLQLEMEKAGQQLSQVRQMKLMVEKINDSKLSEVVALGSVVKTNVGNYFLGVSVGKITVSNEDYFLISPGSPIGRELLGKSKGQSFKLRGNVSLVTDVF